MNYWYSPVLIIRCRPLEAWALAARAEYYSDKNGVIIPAISSNRVQMLGISLNADHEFGHNLLRRIEGRALHNKEPYFTKGHSLSKSTYFITTSMAISL